MRDYIDLGSSPFDEACTQLGAVDYRERMRAETGAYIRQLKRQFGEPPAGARFAVMPCAHDFGTYHEVVIYFEDEDEAAKAFAFRVEGDLPGNWDEVAKSEAWYKMWVLGWK